MNDAPIAKLVSTKPEAEIAADLKRRILEALIPVTTLMDEAASHGFSVQWDALAPQPPYFRHGPVNLRLTRSY